LLKSWQQFQENCCQLFFVTNSGEIMSLATIVILAIIAEAIIEALKPILEPVTDRLSAINLYLILSLMAGVTLALTYDADFLALLLEGEISLTGQILSGIILGRGANFVHDIMERISR
jgi:hypothetical protein